MTLASALLLTTLQAAPAASGYADPVDLFLQVCTRGEGRFGRGSVEQARMIPGAARSEYLRPRRFNRYYQVRLGEGEAFLAIQDTAEPGSRRNRRYCSVASADFSYDKAGTRIDPFFGPLSNPPPFNRRSHLTTSSLGYQISIQRLENMYLVMTSILPGA
jgi:hypothetical protein